MSGEGESADARARQLRQKEAELRAAADRMGRVAGAWEAGADGERRVAGVLTTLESPSCRVLHDRLLEPGRSKVNLDHLVISPAGCYLVDAKNWAGNVVEHEGSLWQHKPKAGGGWNSVPMDPELNSIRRMAERAESAATRVIEPVVCLAGDRADRFGEAKQVRGVWVVPIGALRDWLLARPRLGTPIDTQAESLRLAQIFPSATAAVFPAASLPSTSTSSPPRTRTSKPRKAGATTPRRSGRSRKRTSRAEAIAGLIGLILMLTVGVRLIPHLIEKGFAKVAPKTTTWVSPCSSIDAAQIQLLVGRPVYTMGAPRQDACLWSFHPNAKSYEGADILVATGWSAHASYGANGVSVIYPKDAGIEGIRVPQFVAVPGSTVPAQSISQPIATGVRFENTGVSQAQAKAAALALAQMLALHMPAGPGSTEVRFR